MHYFLYTYMALVESLPTQEGGKHAHHQYREQQLSTTGTATKQQQQEFHHKK